MTLIEVRESVPSSIVKVSLLKWFVSPRRAAQSTTVSLSMHCTLHKVLSKKISHLVNQTTVVTFQRLLAAHLHGHHLRGLLAPHQRLQPIFLGYQAAHKKERQHLLHYFCPLSSVR